jgi:two-component system phosphate regulon sensor histidine kinase PhoR
MKRFRLLWQVFALSLALTLIAIFSVTWYATDALREFHFDQTANRLEIQARLLADRIPRPFDRSNTEAIQEFCTEIKRILPGRLTVILPDGSVVGDSDENPRLMDNHNSRPEVMEALEGNPGNEIRFSDTIKADLMYVAVPIVEQGVLRVIVRSSYPLNAIDRTLASMYKKILRTAAIIALVAGFVSWLVSRRISGPLEDMRRGVERYAKGDFTHRLPTLNSGELSVLVEATNQMASQLEDRIDTVVRQKNELDAVLSSMVEGVLALDGEDRLLSLNNAAAEMLRIDPRNSEGRSVRQIVQNSDFLGLLEDIRISPKEVIQDFTFQVEGRERLLQATGTALHNGENRRIGTLVVMHDVTDLRSLENMRREFVANVSHEIRTPITSIKGFVETLLEGALDDREDAYRFLNIIAKQADRLNSVVEDILTLSRLDQVPSEEAPVFEEVAVRNILESAIEACDPRAVEKSIDIQNLCSEKIVVQGNRSLLEQAVINLVDNAIKYSEDGKTVEVGATVQGGSAVITVKDQGFGIPAEHLPRVFERFYRVDKARSRKLGGTGLGLAIVKHIALVHRGEVRVESRVNEGSLFSLVIPTAQEEQEALVGAGPIPRSDSRVQIS